ncbi:peptidase inhibitor family I36 protein [Streptomyces sp. NPDC048845]|uniref:peptidase inhibitor family I36 protein n=1 Tax=Streptomyces sp. NPDC048845 TaxID=3155390 RepID=UPI00343DC6C5
MSVATGLLAPALAVTPTATATTAPGPGSTADMSTSAAAGYADCPKNKICFWPDFNARGTRCTYENTNHKNTQAKCFWMADKMAKSIYNRTGHRVHYYLDKNFKKRLGSTTSGDSGNLSGRYTIGSLCRHNIGACPN